ncbi:MAG: hypothetical protein HYZ72_08750 [Deltaproteobacteria bacterium]|nr:hypothetical protein [Deltaproteobacteria bacterium]
MVSTAPLVLIDLQTEEGITGCSYVFCYAPPVRRSVGTDILLMADYNQSLAVAEAVRRSAVLDNEGLYWIEEPTLAHDYLGHAQISREVKTPIQIGENWWGPHDMAKSLAAGASDYVMPDAMKIGGVTGWLRAAALAELAGLPISSHLFPEISAHLLEEHGGAMAIADSVRRGSCLSSRSRQSWNGSYRRTRT